MNLFRGLLIPSLLVLAALGLWPQAKPAYEARPLAAGIYELVTHDESGLLLKVIVSSGDDGLLIVDSGYQAHGDALAEALKKFAKGMPRFIINTHSHAEHLGGQITLGKGPLIIGQENLRDRYVNGLYVFNEFPAEALPQITFSDSLSLFFNGEEIKLIAFPGAHDNSDTIVWFTQSKIVCTGALCNCHHFPSVDGDTGNITLYPETVEKIIGILPEDVLLVPGHAENCQMADFRNFHGMLVKTREIVRSGLAKGKTLEQLRQEDVLADYKSYESYMKRNDWLQLLVAGLTAKKEERAGRPYPYGLLYRVQKEKGAAATIQLYNEMKTKQSGRYYLTENTLLFVGRRVVRSGNYPDGIRLLEYYQKEFPQGANMPLCYSGLAAAHEKLGNKVLALKYYRLLLESYPDEQSIKDKVKELEKATESK